MVITNINCGHFEAVKNYPHISYGNCLWKGQKKILGIFKRKCILFTDPNAHCAAQVMYPRPNGPPPNPPTGNIPNKPGHTWEPPLPPPSVPGSRKIYPNPMPKPKSINQIRKENNIPILKFNDSECNLDKLFTGAFGANHPAMLDWISIKFELAGLRIIKKKYYDELERQTKENK